jgi:hypothetical protein
LDLRSGYH